MWNWVSNIGSLLGIAGISFTNFVDDPTKAWLSFAAFLLLIFFLAWKTYQCTKHFMNLQYPKGYLPLSSAAKWTTADGKNVAYEAIRHIQIKQPVMRSFLHHFHWTGTHCPRVTSVLQKVSEVRQVDGDATRKVELFFPQTRVYNDVEILHIQMHLDDADQKADPFLSHKVEAPIRLITFQVELLHANKKYFGQKARVTRRPFDRATANEEEIDVVAFDPNTKSFSYKLLNPEPGYVYKFAWNRPLLPGQRR